VLGKGGYCFYHTMLYGYLFYVLVLYINKLLICLGFVWLVVLGLGFRVLGSVIYFVGGDVKTLLNPIQSRLTTLMTFMSYIVIIATIYSSRTINAGRF